MDTKNYKVILLIFICVVVLGFIVGFTMQHKSLVRLPSGARYHLTMDKNK